MRKSSLAACPSLLLSLVLLSGCMFIPDYHRPDLPVQNQYPVAGGAGPAAADMGWKVFFADPALQQLIAFSLANNRNLRISALNVQSAEAQYRVSRASLFPTLQGVGTALEEGIPAGASTSNPAGSGQGVTLHEYSLGAEAVSWELDLFGKIRSQAEAARQTYLSDAETALSVQIALVAQVAAEYDTWLADRESLQIAENTAATNLKSLQLTQLEAQHGTGTALDVAQSQVNYDTARAYISQYQRMVAQDMDEIVLLAGAPLPPALVQQMQQVAGLSNEPPLPEVPAGLPSDLLTRRPDIRAAEHQLLAANANIGAARAAFFPSISLTANGGVASNSLSSLFDGGQGSWMFEPQITLPIFTGGANLANLDLAKIEKRVQIANYEQTIQSAFHDVSDALAGRTTYSAQLQAQQDLVAADQRYYQLASMRFNTGIDNYLNVLIAQNALLNARLNLVALRLAQQQNEITLYKALGGGWEAENTPVAAAQPAAAPKPD